MTTSNYAPALTVEVAFDGGVNVDPAAWTWTDISDYVELQDGVEITSGRTAEQATASPMKITMTLDNRDGRFTPENTASPYYPNVQLGRPVRVRAQTNGNHVPNPTFETNTSGWSGGGTVPPTLTRSTVRAWQGTASLLITWGTGGVLPLAQATATGLVVGQTYTLSAYGYVPTGSPSIQLAVSTVGTGPAMTTKDAWTLFSYTFTATATSHNVQVWPTSSPTAGQTAYVDGVQLTRGTDVLAFTSAGPETTDRGLGFVDEWPVEWRDDSDVDAVSRLTASGRLARLGSGVELRSVVEEAVLELGPFAYYTLGESSQATAAVDTSGNGQPSLRAMNLGGAAPTFGNATGPATDGLTGVTIANNGNPLRARLTGTTAGSDWTVVWFFTTTDTSTAAMLGFGDLWVDVNQWVANEVSLRTPATTATSDPGGVVNDGELHCAVLSWDDSANLVELRIDGVMVADQTDAGAEAGPELIVGNNRAIENGGAPDDIYTLAGSFFHVAVFDRLLNSTERESIRLAGFTGYADELAAARFARWMGYVGMPAAALTSDPGSLPLSHIDTTGKTLEGLFRIVETTEAGVLFDGRDGTLTFHDREHRHGSPNVLFGFSAASGYLATGLRPLLDRSEVLNDVTAKNLNDTLSARYYSQTSIDELGPVRADVEIATDDETIPLQAAAWRVNRYAVPRVRIDELGLVDLVPLAFADQNVFQDATVGTRFTVSGLPAAAPSSSMSFYVEGWIERFGVESWTLTFQTSAADLSDTWTLAPSSPNAASVLDDTTVLAY